MDWLHICIFPMGKDPVERHFLKIRESGRATSLGQICNIAVNISLCSCAFLLFNLFNIAVIFPCGKSILQILFGVIGMKGGRDNDMSKDWH